MTADVSYVAWNRFVWWVRQIDASNAKATIYFNGALKLDAPAAGTLGGMDSTTQFGAYTTSYADALLANVVILNNPTAADVQALVNLGA